MIIKKIFAVTLLMVIAGGVSAQDKPLGEKKDLKHDFRCTMVFTGLGGK